MESSDVSLSDIEKLRSNFAWKWFIEEWEDILNELQSTWLEEEAPAIYRTAGRVSAIEEMLTTIDRLEDTIKEVPGGI